MTSEISPLKSDSGPEMTFTDSPIENCARLRGRSAVSDVQQAVDLGLGQRDRLVGGADEAGHAGRALHQRPRVLVEVHLDEHVARHGPLLDGDLLVVLHLRDGLGRDDDLPDRALLVERHHAVLEVVLDLVFVAGVGVDDVPAEHVSLRMEKALREDELDELGGDEVGHAEVDTGDDHEADHDAGRLHHLPAVRPLYPLQLAPASPEELDQAGRKVRALRRDRGGRWERRPAESSPGSDSVVRVTLIVVTVAGVGLVFGDLRLGQLRPPDHELLLGELDVRGSVLERTRRIFGPVVARGGYSRPCGSDLRWAHAAVLRCGVYGCEPLTDPARLARFAVRGVAPAPAAVLAQLHPLRIVPLALVRLIVPALALLAGEGCSDPDVSTGHFALLWW